MQMLLGTIGIIILICFFIFLFVAVGAIGIAVGLAVMGFFAIWEAAGHVKRFWRKLDLVSASVVGTSIAISAATLLIFGPNVLTIFWIAVLALISSYVIHDVARRPLPLRRRPGR